VNGRSDPLGKRALYWMPVDQVEAAETAGDAGADEAVRGRPRPTSSSVPHARPSGKHALYSRATPAGEHEKETSLPNDTDPLPPRGLFSVACSSCGSVTRVGVVHFAVLQFPFGAWLPRPRYDRWMTCPACRRRTWTSVTLAR
jgi:hypothetical protein